MKTTRSPHIRRLTIPFRRLGSVALALVLLAAQALTATAGSKAKMTLYVASGTFGAPGSLYTINQTTGAVLTTVGPLLDAAGGPYGMTGMKYDPLNGSLYGVTQGDSPTNPSYLVTIDPATARVTPIGPNGVVLTDIAIDPKTGTMYGVSGFNQKFYTINITTGLATQTGSTGLGFQNGGGFGVNSRGVLYGVDNFSTYTYNKVTGAATLIGLNLLQNLVKGADFDPNGVFYGVEGGGGSDNTHLRFLVTINLTTGIGILIAPIPINDLDSMAFVPAAR